MPIAPQLPSPDNERFRILKAALQHVEGPDRLRLFQLLQQSQTSLRHARSVVSPEANASHARTASRSR